jgi:hypothetical protein
MTDDPGIIPGGIRDRALRTLAPGHTATSIMSMARAEAMRRNAIIIARREANKLARAA